MEKRSMGADDSVPWISSMRQREKVHLVRSTSSTISETKRFRSEMSATPVIHAFQPVDSRIITQNNEDWPSVFSTWACDLALNNIL